MIRDSPLLTSQSSRDDITSVRRDVLNEKKKKTKTRNEFAPDAQRDGSGVTKAKLSS